MINLRWISGFGEQMGSNLAGFVDLIAKIKLVYPDLVAINSLYNSETTIVPPPSPRTGPFVLLGNSWGGAAAMCFADLNPGITIDLMITVDAIASPLKKPAQWPCLEWDFSKRPNIKNFVLFREPYSIFLEGSPVRGLPQIGPDDLTSVSPFIKRQYATGAEYVLNKMDPVIAELEHFDILPLHPAAVQVVMDALAALPSA